MVWNVFLNYSLGIIKESFILYITIPQLRQVFLYHDVVWLIWIMAVIAQDKRGIRLEIFLFL